MSSAPCPVLGGRVTQVTDLEGNVIRIVCAEYEQDGTCRLKKSAFEGGPLSQLLTRMSEDALATRSTSCVLRAA